MGGRRTCSGRVPPPPHDKAGDPTDEQLGSKFPPGFKMIASFFPLKKLRRNGKYLLLGGILLAGLVAVYQEMLAAKAWSSNIGKFAVASPQTVTQRVQTSTDGNAPVTLSFYLS